MAPSSQSVFQEEAVALAPEGSHDSLLYRGLWKGTQAGRDVTPRVKAAWLPGDIGVKGYEAGNGTGGCEVGRPCRGPGLRAG